MFVPVGRCQGVASSVHQVHDFGAGLGADVFQETVGIALDDTVLRRPQYGAQGRQVAEDLWQDFVAVQGTQQVGDVEVQCLTILPRQFTAVITLGQMLKWPQQRCQAQGEQGQAAPTGSAGEGWSHEHRVPEGTAALCLGLLRKALAERITPVRLNDVPLLLQQAAIEPRVQRPNGGCRVVTAGDRLQLCAGLVLRL
ncbi:hypothetical protein D3C85_902980 [compost metagenome]